MAVLDWLQRLLNEPQASAVPWLTGAAPAQQGSARPDILQMLQAYLATPPGLRDLPEPVRNSILYGQSYGEGETGTGRLGPGGAEALNSELQGPARAQDRGDELAQQLEMYDILRRGNPAQPESGAPWRPSSPSSYPRPLPAPAQRFPFGLY